jgi:hypothetical protein
MLTPGPLNFNIQAFNTLAPDPKNLPVKYNKFLKLALVSCVLVTTQSVPINERIKSYDLFKSKEVKQLQLHNFYPDDDPLF